MSSDTYSAFIPVVDDTKYDPLTPFTHIDPAARALAREMEGVDPLAFLVNAQVSQITPVLGDEISGMDLTTLDSNSRDQLALLAARRGVLVFRNQVSFLGKDAEWFKIWGSHFGRLHIHQVGLHPKGFPEMLVIYRSPEADFNTNNINQISSTRWHSDVSYELQPPGVTSVFLFSQPPTGGDTLFASTVAALKQFSPEFASFLKTLKAVHSGVPSANYSSSGHRGGIVRREPVENVHPVVRKHPVTGEEAIFVNKPFTRRIAGFKQEESDLILNFLNNHIATGGDFQARVKWEPYTVIVWDNRVVAHSAVVDFNCLRHGGRITAQAERPIPAHDTLNLG